MQRLYTMDDLKMQQRSQLFCTLYREDETKFRNAFPMFTAAYADEFQAAIDDADDVAFDDEVRAGIMKLTEQINAKMKEANTALARFYGYVKIAFDDDRAMRLRLGHGGLAKARINVINMGGQLDFVHRNAEEPEIKAVLLAAGYTQADIDKLAALADELEELKDRQQDAKTERYELTSQRIEAFNKVWGFMREISTASRVVFADEPAKLQMYRLYDGRKPKAKKEKERAEEANQ